MGEMHDMYGHDEDGLYNPMDGDYDEPEALDLLLEQYRAGKQLPDDEFKRIRGGAMKAVARALRTGTLSKGPCTQCGSGQFVEGHHESYLREDWLDVVWLCRDCHDDIHPWRVDAFPRDGKPKETS